MDSPYPVTTPHKGWHPAAQPSQQPIQMENFPFLLRPSEWGQIPSCLNCPLSAAGRGTKPHMKNVVNTSFRAAPLIIFWRELRSSVPSTHAWLGQPCKRCLMFDDVCNGELNTFIILCIKSSHCVNGVPTSAFKQIVHCSAKIGMLFRYNFIL